MLDKGYTEIALRKMGKLMPDEFQIKDLGEHANTGMLRRAIEYRVVIKVRTGWYKVADGVSNPLKSYQEIAKKIRSVGNPLGRGRGKRDIILATAKSFPGPGEHNAPQHQGPSVSIASYGQQSIIVVGKQIFIGIEVALVPKGGRHG